jgi:hypothetical protein
MISGLAIAMFTISISVIVLGLNFIVEWRGARQDTKFPTSSKLWIAGAIVIVSGIVMILCNTPSEAYNAVLVTGANVSVMGIMSKIKRIQPAPDLKCCAWAVVGAGIIFLIIFIVITLIQNQSPGVGGKPVI